MIPFEERPVGEVMSGGTLAVTATESALMAWELMRKGGRHHIPVISPDGHCIDVLDAETMAAAWEGGGPDRMRTPVSALVGRRPLPRVGAEESVAAAARAMLAAGTDVVPVIDGEERLVGLFTTRNLVALAAGEEREAEPEQVSGSVLYRIEPVLPDPGDATA
jgi:CBS domain-containing protein